MRDYYCLAAIGAFHLRQDVKCGSPPICGCQDERAYANLRFPVRVRFGFRPTEIHLPRHFIAKGFMPEEFRLTGSSLSQRIYYIIGCVGSKMFDLRVDILYEGL